MLTLSFHFASIETIKALCNSGILDELNWRYSTDMHNYLLFYRGSEIIGAVEYSFNPTNSVAHIDVIEVVKGYRN